MRRITLLIWAIFIIIQNTFGWDWPQNRNTNGGTPEQPTTIYLGDQGSFGHDSWAALNDKTPKWQVVISTNADLSTNALYGDWSAYNKYEHKTALSPRFTSTGTWYWGMKVEYTDAGNTTAWYCRNVVNWENMYGAPTSNLTITVSELGEPISQSATSESSSSINLSWNKWEGRNVMILRKRSTDSWTEPTQGTPYSTGTSLGQGIVIYNGGLTAFTDIGLEPGVTYDYKYYSENYSYYSTGVTAQATTDNTSATDNFRSKITGNWNTASNWDSSPDNTNWVTSTLVPGASATSITILTGHNITLDNNVTIPGLTINSGATFTASDASLRILTITKSPSGTSTTLTNNGTWSNGTGGSTVVFTGAPSSGDAIHAITGTIPFQKVIINKTGGSSNVGAGFAANCSVSQSLEIGTGGYVSTDPPASFYGQNAVLKFNQGTGENYYINSGDKTWSTTVVPNSITINSGTVTVNDNRTASGTVIIDNGATLVINATKMLTVSTLTNSGTITNNGTLTLKTGASGTSHTLTNNDTWSNGTGGSTVVFTGDPSLGDAIHAITGTIPFQKVIINKTGGSSNVGADFGANCSVSQSLEIGNGGFVSTDPPASFYGQNAVLKFNQGTGANYEINPGDKTWSTTVVPNSITINSGTVTVKEDRTASGTVIIDNGANLVVNESKQLTAGTLTNNGTLTLKSGATALTTTISGTGTTNVEQYLSSGRQWWYLSSPLSGAYTGTVFSGSQVGIYDEDDFNYTGPFASSTLMSPGLGHVVKFPNTYARTITFTGGSLNNSDITIAPTRTGTANAKRGFNLIGNPYPSYIDWDLLYDPASATNMRNAIWFRTWNGTMTFHTYSDGDGVPDQASGKIAPMQGFWVKVHADGSNGSLTFKNTHRSHYASGYNPLKVKAADDRQRVRLVLSDGTYSDETLIVGKSYASDSQDAYDIEKMSNESTDISEIYSMIGTETMVINSVAPITAGKTVALGIRSTSEKAYSITASQLQNIPTDVRVVLVDAEDESETELSEGVSYNFVASAGAVNNRFSIQFRSPGATTLVDNDSKNKILVYSNSQQQIEIISTESLPAGTQIRVFNAAGQNVAGVQAAGNHIHIPVALGKGVYFCHIENTNQNLQYKVFVR